MHVIIHIPTQTLTFFGDDQEIKKYQISTALKGVGELKDSQKTPRGRHLVRAKIGLEHSVNTVL